MSSFVLFIKNHKYLLYGYIIWLLLHISCLIVGGNDAGFFPFGYHFFDMDDYGFIEFFVYTIALPVTAFIFVDVFKNNESFRCVLKWTGIISLFILDVICVYALLHGVIIGFLGFFNKDVIVSVQNSWSVWTSLFGFYDTPQTICTIISIVISLIAAAGFAISYFTEGRFNKQSREEYLAIVCCAWLFCIVIALTFWLFSKFEGASIIWLLFVILLLIVWGVITLFRRIRLNLKHGSYIGKMIYKKKVCIGMSKDQCIESWGNCLNIDSVKQDGEPFERWSYPEHYLLFKDNILWIISKK